VDNFHVGGGGALVRLGVDTSRAEAGPWWGCSRGATTTRMRETAMSKLYVTNINELPKVARRIQPSALISLVPMEEQPITPSGVDPARHLRLLIHDITTSDDASILPQAEHIQTLIDFIRGWKQQDGPLLLHCIAGVSRSPAAALITLVTLAPGHEREAARALRRAGPHFMPNRRMIQLADDILGTGGRLLAACAAMGPADLTGEPPTEVEIPLLDPSTISRSP